MIPLLMLGLVAILLWSLFSERLRRWHITGPVALVICGIAVGLPLADRVANELDTGLAERIVELILAVLLFIDATEVRGGYLGGQRSIVVRLLVFALPVSLVLAVLVGMPLLGASSLAVLVAVALVVIPADFAPAAGFFRDARIPQRLRNALAVESGYADLLRAPVFAFALAIIEFPEQEHGVAALLEHALPDIGFAIIVGVAMGALTGLIVRVSLARGWVLTEGVRLATVLIPLVTYAVSVLLHGNGFVAAFIAGITYRLIRLGRRGAHDAAGGTNTAGSTAHGGSSDTGREAALHRELTALNDIGALASLLMWFVFGAVVAIAILAPIVWPWLIFGLLALVPLRSIPVHLSMLGSGLRWRERSVLAFMGPRGTATIMFGLLAFNAMPEGDDDIALYVMVVTVLASVILHGLFGTRISRALAGRSENEARPTS